MAPQRCSTIQEEVQHYEAEVAERQKSLQEMKAGREWPKSCENSRHVRGDFGLAGKELIMSNSCGIWKMLRETVSQHGEGHGESKILHWYSQVLWLNFWFPYLLFDLTLFRFVLLFIQKVLRDAITHNLSQEEFSSELKDAGAVLPHKRAGFWWFNDWPMAVERRTLNLSQQAEVTRKHAWGMVLCNFYKARKKQLDVGHHVLLRTIVTYPAVSHEIRQWDFCTPYLCHVYIPSVTGAPPVSDSIWDLFSHHLSSKSKLSCFPYTMISKQGTGAFARQLPILLVYMISLSYDDLIPFNFLYVYLSSHANQPIQSRHSWLCPKKRTSLKFSNPSK